VQCDCKYDRFLSEYDHEKYSGRVSVLDKQREIWTRKKYQVRVVRCGNGNYAILIDEWQRNELLEFPEEYVSLLEHNLCCGRK
jgi:hypothetical protein